MSDLDFMKPGHVKRVMKYLKNYRNKKPSCEIGEKKPMDLFGEKKSNIFISFLIMNLILKVHIYALLYFRKF